MKLVYKASKTIALRSNHLFELYHNNLAHYFPDIWAICATEG